MKIGIIKHRYVAEGGGSERYTNGLIDGLLRLGHEVHMFAHVVERPAASVIIHKVPVAGGPAFLRQRSFARACKNAVARVECDLIFSAERTIRQDIVRAGGGCHREYLIQCRRYYSPMKRLGLRVNLLHPTLLALERQTFSPRNTRVVIANSHRGKEEIARHYKFPADRMEVIHNGTDCERFRLRARENSEKLVLLFVGSGFERKGLGFAIEALARLPADVELRIAGKGKTAHYQRLTRKLGVEQRVHFLGVRQRIEDVYAQGDILVHPAIYEPFSNACLEAMACGLPVVTSRMNGASEIITQGQNGAVVEDPGETAALAAAIELFSNRKRLREASAQARHTAEALPMSLNVERTLATIERVAHLTSRT
jgi:UDP-glucose:(heptosyl)LPS alpha-1,3-glucosyltransferase